MWLNLIDLWSIHVPLTLTILSSVVSFPPWQDLEMWPSPPSSFAPLGGPGSPQISARRSDRWMNLIGSREAWCHWAALFKRKARTGEQRPLSSALRVAGRDIGAAVTASWVRWVGLWLLEGNLGVRRGSFRFRKCRTLRPWNRLLGRLTLFISGFAWQVQTLVKFATFKNSP